MVKFYAISFFLISSLLHGIEPLSQSEKDSFNESLYNRFMQPFRKRVQDIGNFDKKPLRVYEHLDPERVIETREYLKYNSLLPNKLVDSFISDFLEVDTNVEVELLRIILTNIASRDVGQLEIQLLMTNMSVRKNFLNMVVNELNSRYAEFSTAISVFDDSKKGTLMSVVVASYRLSNVLKLLINPVNPDAVVSEDLDMFNAVDCLEKFLIDGKQQIEAFLARIGEEKPYSAQNAAGIIVDSLEEKVGAVHKMSRKLRSAAKQISEAFTKISLRFGDKNCFSHQRHTRASHVQTVKINFRNFDLDSGIVLYGGHYCYTRKYYENKKKNVGAQQKTVYGSLFHEFDHALHWFEGRDNGGLVVSLRAVYGSDHERILMWKNDEEFLTIIGLLYIASSNELRIDPVNCASFCRSEKGKSANFNIRSFHKTPPISQINSKTPSNEIPVSSDQTDNELLEEFLCRLIP